jgi:hypothetical protein
MRHIFSILILFIITFLQIDISANTLQDKKIFEKEFNRILYNLDSIITNSENQHPILKAHFDFIKNKIYNGELPIAYDTTLNYDFFRCSSFNVSADDTQDVDIAFGQFVIDKYNEFPSLVNAIVINSFQYAYDYYNNQELFIIGFTNHIEKTYFDIDAMTLEAIFLHNYVQDRKTLGYVERYLIADLKNNMNGSATLFRKIDLELLHKIDNLKKVDQRAEKLLKKYDKIGKELIKTTSFKDKSEWENYCSIITLKTYVFYSQQVIFDIVHLKNGVSMASFNLEDYPDCLQTINDVKKIIAENNDYFRYHYETMKMFADYYKK